MLKAFKQEGVKLIMRKRKKLYLFFFLKHCDEFYLFEIPWKNYIHHHNLNQRRVRRVCFVLF